MISNFNCLSSRKRHLKTTKAPTFTRPYIYTCERFPPVENLDVSKQAATKAALLGIHTQTHRSWNSRKTNSWPQMPTLCNTRPQREIYLRLGYENHINEYDEWRHRKNLYTAAITITRIPSDDFRNQCSAMKIPLCVMVSWENPRAAKRYVSMWEITQ